jgi:hypothetical protein
MGRFLWPAFMVGVLCSGCGTKPGARLLQADFRSSLHDIPEGGGIWRSAFQRDPKGKLLFAVLTYHGNQPIEQSGVDQLAVGTRRVDFPPTDGAVHVLDVNLQYHLAPITAAELYEALWGRGADSFYDSELWQNRLHPFLMRHRWPDDKGV